MVGLLTGLNDCTLKLGFWIARTITLGEIPSPNRHSELFLYLSKTFHSPQRGKDEMPHTATSDMFDDPNNKGLKMNVIGCS